MIIIEYLKILRFRFNYLMAILCGLFLAGITQGFDLMIFLAVMAFSYSALFYGTMVNFFYDKRIDEKNPAMKTYGHVSGKIPAGRIGYLKWLFFISMFLSGAVLYLMTYNVFLVPLMILALHCGFSYSAPPLRLKRFWWGGIITYTLSTSVVFLISALSFRAGDVALVTLTVLAFWSGSLSGWALAHISDKKYDLEEGITTPAVRFGRERCIRMHTVFALLSCIFASAASYIALGVLFVLIPFAATALISLYSSESVGRETGGGMIRKKSYTLGVSPYWLNMAFLMIIYFSRMSM
jgi:4-hydroxybenzoate polyprenyltransferase